ncbi:MAG TPA: MBL fold metallo-hydrolase [Bdellovibrionales bacterium]|nr:MBL fold metallo-hydrolase [Bdellovibrionales bacterium]
MSVRKDIQVFHDPDTATLTYVVWDPGTRDAAIIDPVLDFDPALGAVSSRSSRKLAKFIQTKRLRVHWVLDTHAHADHLSSSSYLRDQGAAEAWGLSEKMFEVFATFKKAFAWPPSLTLTDLGVDRFFRDGEEFSAGSLRFEALATPGHTAACTTYRMDNWLFTGDALFMPDGGVGRCDFPGGSASVLYDSIWEKLYAFPNHYLTFTGHDYMPGGRPLKWAASIGEQKRANIHLRQGISKEEFVRFREGRDKTLSAPRLLNPSLDWNLGAFQIVKP